MLNLSKADGIGVFGEDEKILEQNKEERFPGSVERHCELGRPGKFVDTYLDEDHLKHASTPNQ